VNPLTIHLSAGLLAWLDAYGPVACVGFVLACAMASFRGKRDRY
jgi:hypothetical protein